jgi:TP901-1 family phage major tail protein
MATIGKVNGTLLRVYVGGVAVANTTSASIETSMSGRDTTTKDSAGWKEIMEGLREWTISGDYLFEEAAAYGYTDLFALITARTSVVLIFSSEVTGDKIYTGTAYLTSLSKEAPMEETVSGSYTFEGTGALVESLYV